ncbi:glycosyltransferase family 9 protein [Limimaricola cinnabarinus]|uniref:glycosyltransferase family 9 protein n=1 Tax=Limimaricola cinnabarinus TaxID=1125964 RepID=UPI0005ECE392|nr:glycosyltransferase family 9 protein [Limimaricola cinnabarinus]
MARSSNLTRRLDRAVGTAAASLLSPFRSSRPQPADPRRILLIQPTAIGDTLIASGLISAIERRYPAAEIVVAHGPSNAAAVKMLEARVRPVQVGFANPARAVAALKALSPDMIVDLTPWPYATALCAHFSAPWSAGFNPQGSRRGRLFDLSVPHRTDRHEIDNLDALSQAIGAGPAREMRISRDASARADLPASDGLVLCHVSAGGARAAAKAWPVENWVALARGLVAQGYQVGFTGVPADAEAVAPILEVAALPADRAFSLCGKLSLAALAELLAEVPLLISVDTGVLHLSAAVSGRAIGLHGPTHAARWGSVSPAALGLDSPHPAGGFVQYGWEDHPQAEEIMPMLTPERVLSAALDKLEAQPRLRANEDA